jgi:hypothetical protein
LTHTLVVQNESANASACFLIIHTLFSNIKACSSALIMASAPSTCRAICANDPIAAICPNRLDGYLIRRAVECATVTYNRRRLSD